MSDYDPTEEYVLMSRAGLGTDPAQDVRAFADVRFTIRAGRVIYGDSRSP
jgi:hypothetical protein